MAIGPLTDNIKRYKVIRIVAVCFFAVLIVQLFRIQIIKHGEYEARATSQQTQEIVIEAKRGAITDRNGSIFAVSAAAYKVVMAPSVIEDDSTREKIADGLSSILDVDREKIYAMTQKESQYIVVSRRIEKDIADKVSEFIAEDRLLYGGILSLVEDTKRYYPNGNLLSTVLGFIGSDDQGLEGIEYSYDKYLNGTDGRLVAAKTSVGTSMPFEYEKQIDAKDGATVALTVDIRLQSILEKYLEDARVEYNVQNRVSGIIMDVDTFEVLAMSSKPDFDPNSPFSISDEMTLTLLKEQYGVGTTEYIEAYNSTVKTLRQNKTLQQYEPGSTFKIFTGAMALEEGLVSLSETFNCPGFLKIGSITVHCSRTTGHGTETFKEAVANSCNPVFMTLGLRVGKEKFYDYVTLFGFRDKTGVGLSGEESGIHHALTSMTNLDLAESSFGQTFKITPIQLITSVCAVANGGTYMQPYIIKSVIDSDGNTILKNKPTALRTIVSEETCATLVDCLEYTVQKSRNAYAKGYRICGKTGTSEKLDTGDETARVASFVCFAPADDPQVAVLIVVDEPNASSNYGSTVAAPVGKNVIVEALEYLNISPDYGEDGKIVTVSIPDMTDIDSVEAVSQLAKKNIRAVVVGGEGTVKYQIPAADTELDEGSTVILYTAEDVTGEEISTVVPDLIGKTAAECNQLLVNSNLNIKVIGNNINYPETVAVSQSVSAGTSVRKSTVITVTFKGK